MLRRQVYEGIERIRKDVYKGVRSNKVEIRRMLCLAKKEYGWRRNGRRSDGGLAQRPTI